MKRKRELIELILELDREGANAEQIGDALGYSGQYVRDILRRSGRPSRNVPVPELLRLLPVSLRERVNAWREARRLVPVIKQNQ